MYEEFLNCESNIYKLQEKNSDSISSDGEFNEFNYYDLVEETDETFVREKYIKLLNNKYQGEILKKFIDGHYIDEDLRREAELSVKTKAKDRKYLSKKLVTHSKGIVISRWASDNH